MWGTVSQKYIFHWGAPFVEKILCPTLSTKKTHLTPQNLGTFNNSGLI